MEKTESEKKVSKINSSVFLQEFTFAKNDFKVHGSKNNLEFADNVVWLDDIFFVYQTKEQEVGKDESINWFNNKVLKKAVKQIKDTLKYIAEYPEIYIQNEKGHKLDIVKARNDENCKKIIVYSPQGNLPDECRTQKIYESNKAGIVHLFHIEDYYWICKLLTTPTEIKRYLDFRENLFLFNKALSNALPEQYFLGHFFETQATDHFNVRYIENINKISDNIDDSDIRGLLKNFYNPNQRLEPENQYYTIVKELAKLDRFELREFKKRLLKCIEVSENEEFILPFRMYVPRTDCGFIFIPLHSKNAEYWENALLNYTDAHIYDMKAFHCIGVVIYKDPQNLDWIEIRWMFVENEWAYNEEMEKILASDDNMLRKMRVKALDNDYKIK